MIGMFKSSVELTNVTFQLFLHSKSFSLALAFRLKCTLHSINGFGEILASTLEFFFFLTNATFNFSSYLSQLKLSTKDFVFLLFQGAFSLFQCSLKFHFFSFQALSDFVNFVD